MSDIGPLKKFKTKKLMWAQISKDMMTMLNLSKTPLQIENRYKTVLKRKKKQLRITLIVPFEEEFRKIARSDDSIEPEVLRSARRVKYPKLDTQMSEEISNDSVSTHSTDSSPSNAKKSKQSNTDKKMEYWEKKEAAKKRRHQEKLRLIRELFAKEKE